ncbi:MAG: tRNA pseudouridine(38-40) synthase TruA [Pseudonocardiales bacterium]|nr:MAG: tRNA pseudouridine(38-40) synthase TruA [Pseudonocardiales bacterium]
MAVSDHADPSLDVSLADADAALVRIRLDVSYDGTDFSGWAVQPGQRTVQGTLQDALSTVLRVPPVTLTVAGRTDAGVHATGQVAHFDLPATVWAKAQGRLVHKLSGVLPRDLRVKAVTQVPDTFDARFGALWRRYLYRISDAEGGIEPLQRRQVLPWRRPLDVAAMSAAAAPLVGLHDFVAYCRRREGASTIRTLESLDIIRTPDEIVCTVQADAFCRSMVRSLVGALIAVGEGRRPVEWPAGLLHYDMRCDDIGIAPAHGLTLVEVRYPPEDQLHVRAEQARARRDSGSLPLPATASEPLSH